MIRDLVFLLLFSGLCFSQDTHDGLTWYPMTKSSAVIRQDLTTWKIGTEVLMPPPESGTTVSASELEFELPAPGTVVKLQGTFGAMAPFGNASTIPLCTQPNAALGYILIDGKNVGQFALHFDESGSKDRDIFFSFDIPITYTKGKGIVHIESNPLGCWSDVEIEALMQVSTSSASGLACVPQPSRLILPLQKRNTADAR